MLRHLSELTRRTSYLGRFVGGRIMITDLVEGPESPYLEDLEVGLDVAAHATVIGKTLLAALPKPRRVAYLAEQGMPRFTARTPTGTDELEAELAGIRAGLAVLEHGQFRDGVSCVGALIRRDCAEDPWWTVVASTRDEEVPAQLAWHTLRAAEDLSGDT